MPIVLLCLLLALLTGCERAPETGQTEAPPSVAGTRRPTFYGRQMVLLAGSPGAPAAAVFDFVTYVERDSVRRRAAAWLARDTAWRPLLEASWRGKPQREPWRLVPHGPLRLLVGDAGDVEALVYRGGAEKLRLQPSPPLAEWQTSGALQFRVRRAGLEAGALRLEGALLDIQAGDRLPADGPGTEIFLSDGGEVRLVIAQGAGPGASAWFVAGDEVEALEGVTLAAPVESPARPEGPVPAWRLTHADTLLIGEIQPVGSPLAVPPLEATALGAAEFRLLRGWIELREARHSVFGVLRRGRS